MLFNHTGWGFTTFTDAELITRLSKLTGDSSSAPMRFFCLRNPEQNTREQIRIVRFTSRERNRGAGAGFVLNMDTGILSEVRAAPQQTAA